MHASRSLRGPVVFFTGAGISVGAGLPTYRGTGGLYESTDRRPPSTDDVTPDRLPALWERFRPRLEAYDHLRPSRAHQAIAELDRVNPGAVFVVTQNVDGLHTVAGSRQVIELHGSLRTVRCLDNGHRHDVRSAPWPEGEAPRCPECDSVCRPDIVLFGESLPSGAFAHAHGVMQQARTIVAVGTSAVVYPAAHLIGTDYTGGADCLWINPEAPPPSPEWTWLRGTADTELDRLMGDTTPTRD